MNIVSWNYQGSGGTTCATLSWYLHCTGAQVTFISETRCGKVKAEKRIKSLPLCNSEIVASNGLSGGLWLLWDDSCTVTILSKNKNLIATEINEKGPHQPWILLAVYGDPHRSDYPRIWEQLEPFLSNSKQNQFVLLATSMP